MIIDIENNNRQLTQDDCRSVNGIEEEKIYNVKAYLFHILSNPYDHAWIYKNITTDSDFQKNI